MEKVLKHLFQKWLHVAKNILIDPAQHVMVTVKSEHKVVFFSMERTCGRCSGSGQEIKGKCSKCSNTGRVKENKKLKIKIPAGIETGNRIRMSGEGEAGELGGTNGDLYVFINVTSHKIFERDKNNIICDVAIPFTTAALGGSIEVPTIEKKNGQY